MSDMKIITTIDGETYSKTQLDRLRYERSLHVLHEMLTLGLQLTDKNGRQISGTELNWREPEDVIALLVETHANLGPERSLDLYHDAILDSDRRWHEYNKIPIEQQGCYLSTTRTQVFGIDEKLLAKSRSIQDGKSPFLTMPEHFMLEGDILTGKQIILETFGMLGEPSLVYTTASAEIPSHVPVKRLQDYPNVMAGETFLVHDDFNIHVGAVHQIRQTEDGIDQISTFFCPKSAPKAIADGHKLHFALEFRRTFELLALSFQKQ